MMIGAVLSGRYIVEEIVGTGGMAVVYRAWDNKKKRVVAIKVLRPEYEGDSEFVRRFSREAEAASKMSHENIVNMYDVGIDGETRYIVMEYVEGATLKDMIREMGHLSPDAVVRMGIRILAAVDHAHKNGIVHRDIKPQNILVDREGKVRVADFGIARMKAHQTTRVDDVNASALGSVHYLSPEQASGEVADEKSDLYSLGVVLYEMLTGAVPFDGDAAIAVALKHVSEAPKSMRLADPSISKALDEVVLRALSKDAADRYQTAAEMAMDLRKALTQPGGGFSRRIRLRRVGRRTDRKARAEMTETSAVELRIRRAQRRRRIKYALIGVAIACAMALIATVGWLTLHSRVPDVMGAHESAAFAKLSDSFTVRVAYDCSDTVEVGHVISQSPRAGKFAERGADVVITVSEGSVCVIIGDYAGYHQDEAERLLREAGVRDVEIEYVMDDMPSGTVVEQRPAAGEVKRHSVVTLSVSGETVLVPPLTGYALENARAYIEGEGLALGNVSEAYSADAAAGTVIAQSVAPNAEVLVGSAIDLTIAQSQTIQYYPDTDFRVVVPLDATRVLVRVVAPSGVTYDAYSGALNRGTHSIPLSSAEGGMHAVNVYLDDTLLEELTLMFE
ncbi:MAG: Stk1 family PASTA domain-containing Ser/Thr kinase [Christensenellales bacterium]|jgi:beta-lactam-binding protein with PASTA domain/tRNA A-37 threonylcarbamoyl transferase component Bud32